MLVEYNDRKERGDEQNEQGKMLYPPDGKFQKRNVGFGLTIVTIRTNSVHVSAM
jgi:hypothetical protein